MYILCCVILIGQRNPSVKHSKRVDFNGFEVGFVWNLRPNFQFGYQRRVPRFGENLNVSAVHRTGNSIYSPTYFYNVSTVLARHEKRYAALRHKIYLRDVDTFTFISTRGRNTALGTTFDLEGVKNARMICYRQCFSWNIRVGTQNVGTLVFEQYYDFSTNFWSKVTSKINWCLIAKVKRAAT